MHTRHTLCERERAGFLDGGGWREIDKTWGERKGEKKISIVIPSGHSWTNQVLTWQLVCCEVLGLYGTTLETCWTRLEGASHRDGYS